MEKNISISQQSTITKQTNMQTVATLVQLSFKTKENVKENISISISNTKFVFNHYIQSRTIAHNNHSKHSL